MNKKIFCYGIPAILLGVAILLAAWACSDRKAPTEPGAFDPGATPPQLNQGNHAPGYGRSDCQICHIVTKLPGHENIAFPQCFGCHGNNGTGSGDETCNSCHGFPPNSGNHLQHPQFATSPAMLTADVGPETAPLTMVGSAGGKHTLTAGKSIHRATGAFPVVKSGTQQPMRAGSCDLCHYGAGAGTTLHMNGSVDVIIDPRYPGVYSGGGCQVEVCHGSGRPDWFSTASLTCTSCHSINGGAFNDPRSGLHAASLPSMNSACTNCHEGAPSTHFNQRLDNPDHIKPDGGAYQDNTPNGYNSSGSSGVCSGMNQPCHTADERLDWSSSAGACGSCHGTTPANPPTSGAHAKHAGSAGFSYACRTCHYGFESGTGPSHQNGVANVSLDPAFGGAWDGQNCSSVSCHGSGRPNWFNDHNLSCTACHTVGGSTVSDPRSGKHALHMSQGGFVCSTCHTQAPSTHYNHRMDNPDHIRPDSGAYGDTTPNGYNASGSSGTCSSMTSPCHSSGDWTTSDTGACGSCHGVTPQSPPTEGSHPEHAGANGGRSYPCSMCHYGYSSGTGPDHNNGVVNVAFDPNSLADGNGAHFSNNTCYGIYCHGDGVPPLSGGSNVHPQWGVPSSTTCASCHGTTSANPPRTGQHERHAGELGLACSTCHYGIDPNSNSMPDKILEVVFDPSSQPSASYAYGNQPNSGSCLHTSCHGTRRWNGGD